MTPIKLLLIAAAIFVLYKLFTNDRNRKSKDEAKSRERKIATGEMVKDPICGSYVDVDTSITVRDDKKMYHFCSYECRQKFLDSLQEEGRKIPHLEDKER